MHYFQVLFLYICISNYCSCQILRYYCNFDFGLINDCIFNETTGTKPFVNHTGFQASSSKPLQPLSDVTSILSPTSPNNESCILPYDYPLGNWSMYFCQRTSPTVYTCPTASGTGECVIGSFVSMRVTFGPSNYTYLTKIETISNRKHCLDFYYYLSDSLYDAKLSVGYITDTITETIVEVIAQEENKWQQNRSTFTSPISQNYQLWFRITRDTEQFYSFTFALDEIKVFENSCDYDPTLITTDATDTTETTVDNNQLSSERTDSTTTMTIHTSSTTLDLQETTFKTSTSPDYESQGTISTQITNEKSESTTTTTIDNTTNNTISTTAAPFTSNLPIMTTTTTSLTSSYANTSNSTTSVSPSKLSLTLILGISLGIGIPFVLGLICGLVCGCRRC